MILDDDKPRIEEARKQLLNVMRDSWMPDDVRLAIDSAQLKLRNVLGNIKTLESPPPHLERD